MCSSDLTAGAGVAAGSAARAACGAAARAGASAGAVSAEAAWDTGEMSAGGMIAMGYGKVMDAIDNNRQSTGKL